MAHQVVTNRHRSASKRKAKEVRQAKLARATRRIRIAKGDTVLVIAGEEKGRTGKVLMVIPEKQRVIVEKVNMVKRHVKPTQRQTQGGIRRRKRRSTFPTSLVDPKSGTATDRRGFRGRSARALPAQYQRTRPQAGR